MTIFTIQGSYCSHEIKLKDFSRTPRTLFSGTKCRLVTLKLSRTNPVFKDFQGCEFSDKKIQDFQGCVGTVTVTITTTEENNSLSFGPVKTDWSSLMTKADLPRSTEDDTLLQMHCPVRRAAVHIAPPSPPAISPSA